MSWREWLDETRAIAESSPEPEREIMLGLIESCRLMAKAVEDVENAAGASFGGFVLCPVCEVTYNCEHPGGHDSECRLGAALDFLRGVGCA